MTKFSEITYTRPDFEGEEAKIKAYIQKLKSAASAEEMRQIYLEEQKRCDEFETMQTLCAIRNNMDTTDPFYEKELQVFYQKVPSLVLLYQEADRVILSSPFVQEFAVGLPENLITDMTIDQKLVSQAIEEDMTEEANLCQEYSKLIATCNKEFRGENCNFYQLLKYMQDSDRQIRKEAFQAWADLYAETAPKLDVLYDRMVTLRVGMAKKQGFESYIDYRYASLHRFDYTPEDAAGFRRQVREIVVPICQKAFAEQKDRLGVERIYYYDESLFMPEGNAVPQGTPEEMVE